MPSNSKRSLERLGEDVAVLREDIGRLAESVALLAEQSAKGGLDDLKARAAGGADQARGMLDHANRAAIEALRSIGRKSANRVVGGKDELETMIERNPMAALGIAAAVGFTLALMARGRGSNRD